MHNQEREGGRQLEGCLWRVGEKLGMVNNRQCGAIGAVRRQQTAGAMIDEAADFGVNTMRGFQHGAFDSDQTGAVAGGRLYSDFGRHCRRGAARKPAIRNDENVEMLSGHGQGRWRP